MGWWMKRTLTAENPTEIPRTQLARSTGRVVAQRANAVRIKMQARVRGRVPLALHPSEEIFTAAFQSAPIGMSIHLRADSRFIAINKTFLDMTGLTRDAVIGKTFRELPLWVDPSDYGRLLQQTQTAESVHGFEMAFRRISGEAGVVEIGIDPIIVDQKQCILVSALDITARKRAEEAIRESEARHRQAIIAADAVPYTMDYRTESYTFIGEAISTLTGYSAQEMTPTLMGELIEDVILQGDAADLPLKEAVRLVRAGQLKAWRCDCRIRTRSGESRWFADASIQIYDQQGIPIGSIGILQDITARKQAEHNLFESEERFRRLAEAGFEAISISRDGIIIDCNTRLTEIAGYSLAELIGMPLLDLVADESRTMVFTHIQGGSDGIIAHKIRRKDGNLIPVEMQSKALPFGGQTVVVTAIRDVTERVRLEEQLRQAEKLQAVGQLAGGVAHDFNNLLTIILGYCDVLLHSAPETLREDIGQIQEAGHRAAALTQQLLAFSRRQVLEMHVLDLNEIVEGIVPMLERVVGEDVTLNSVLKATNGQVKADAGQLEQVIVNLVANARDAMPRGGTITLETAEVELDNGYKETHTDIQPGSYILLAVSDTGTGMDSETQNHIFEPFYTTKEAGKGTGLGLATVHGIVKQSGGHIWVYTEPGHGTTFKIYFPRMAAIESESRPELPLPIQATGTETVLVVEDEAAVRKLACTVLEKNGYTVLEATSATVMQVNAEYAGPISLLLTDVVMPHQNGRAIAEQLTSLRPLLKVVYMSGYTDNVIVRHGIEVGSIAFVQKPFTAQTLTQKIRQVLDS